MRSSAAHYTAQGTYLLPFLQMDQVVEYDKDFKEIWRYPIKSPWAAVRLKNGNTLITDENDILTREVNPKGETVWELKPDDLPNPTATSTPRAQRGSQMGTQSFAHVA